ncbi:hypothetical protein AGMMS49545_23700 [Betaproteobacteria bacterium]|nr:hypothetical protein AGMMS49545_23700 [Betaproteobacteria bacterium]
MELQVYEALVAAGAPKEAAKDAAESINKAIDNRYAIHSKELATRGDIEQVRAEVEKTKNDIIKWVIGLFIAQTALLMTIVSKLT